MVKTCFGRLTRSLSDLENFLNVHLVEISFFLFQLKYIKITMNIVHRPTYTFVTKGLKFIALTVNG